MYLEEVGDEVEHAPYPASQLVMLGAAPVLEPDLTVPPTDVRQMLQHDAEAERTDVKNGVRLASLAGQEGLFALRMKMEEQAADEDEHEMRRLLG